MAPNNKTAPRLGRGLSSLISNSLTSTDDEGQYQGEQDIPVGAGMHAERIARSAGGAAEIAVDQIAPNPYQPRREFQADELAELANSIAQQGVIQPIIVVASIDQASGRPYTLIAGERRLRAARSVGLGKVPCIVRQATRQQMQEWALIENIQRSDLNPIERAEAYRSYIDRFSLTHADAAERLGQPRATVSNYLRLLDLCDRVQQMILDGLLTFGHAKILAAFAASPEKQLAIATKVAASGLSVRELERLVARSTENPQSASAEPSRTIQKPAYIRDVEERLTEAVGTRVVVKPGRAKHSGRIMVEYYSLDDFDRISAALGLSSDV